MSRFHRAGSRLALVFGLALIPTAAATPASPAKQQQAKAAHAAHAALVTQLHAAHALLVQADHDYDGHRAKAAHEVTKAIHELTGHHNAGAGGQAGAKNQQAAGQAGAKNQQAGGAKQKMPQAQSDAMLQKAAQMLSATVAKMPAGHKSTAHIHTAITELGTALKIK